jgi:hypothetical protein
MTKKENTEKSLNIYQRLIEVMKEVRYIEKEQKTVNKQYRFVSHDAVTSATSQAFINNGVYAKPRIIKHEINMVNIKRSDKYKGTSYEENSFICNVEVEYEFINIDNPEDKITQINGLGQGIDTQDKACGKAISYACKYALLKALGIETGDDPERDTDYDLSNNQKAANAADEDMKETLSKKNEEDFAGLKAIIESCGGLEELKEVWSDKENNKIIKRLEKYQPNLYQLLIETKDAMKKILLT